MYPEERDKHFLPKNMRPSCAKIKSSSAQWEAKVEPKGIQKLCLAIHQLTHKDVLEGRIRIRKRKEREKERNNK